MAEWWNAMSLAQQIFACMAIPATLILIIQSILLLFGIGGGGEGDVGLDTDVDVDDGGHVDGDGTALFTIRGIVAFFAVGGWVGVLMLYGSSIALSIIVAFLAGAAALVGIGYLFKLSFRLQSSGNLNYENAVGKVGKVYIPIPPRGMGVGKISITLQERFTEINAVSEEDEIIPTGAYVTVTKLLDEDTVSVRIEMPEKKGI